MDTEHILIPDWAIYYSSHDYSEHIRITSEDFTPIAISKRSGVQVIMRQNSDHNWVTLSGYDFYMWDSRGGKPRWWGGDWIGFQNYLLSPGNKCVLFGEYIEDWLFREIFNKAREEFGHKTGYLKNERKP